MNFTQDELAAIVGIKELELIALRRELTITQAKLKEHDDELCKTPDIARGSLAVVKGDKGQDDHSGDAGREDRTVPR